MAEAQYTPLDFQISDAELEQLPPSALLVIIRTQLAHITRQDQRIKELEAEVRELAVFKFPILCVNDNRQPPHISIPEGNHPMHKGESRT